MLLGGGLYFRMLHDEASGSMTYLLADLAAGEAVLIDPRGSDVPVLHALLAEHGLQTRWILRTHEHDDGDPPAQRRAAAALQSLQATVVAHKRPAEAALPFGAECLQVLATPGHTGHCLSFLWRDRLFCGGLMAVDACPYQPRPLDPRALWESVAQQVFTLPGETLLFSGHARRGRAVSTVFEERRWHPWLGVLGRDDFLARVNDLRPAAPVVPVAPAPGFIHS